MFDVVQSGRSAVTPGKLCRREGLLENTDKPFTLQKQWRKKETAGGGWISPFFPTRCAAKHQVFAKTFQLQSHKTAITPVLFALRLQNDPVHAALREWWSERFYCNDLLWDERSFRSIEFMRFKKACLKYLVVKYIHRLNVCKGWSYLHNIMD